MATSTKWRINISESNGTVSIGEMEMRGEPSGADLCSGGTASASADYFTATAAQAFDNDTSTFWQAGNTSVLAGWLQYEFVSAAKIVEYAIVVIFSDYSPKSWTLEYWNGSAWKVVDTQNGQTTWNAGQYHIFSVPEQTPPATLSAWENILPRTFTISPEHWAWIDPTFVNIPLYASVWIDNKIAVARMSVGSIAWFDHIIVNALQTRVSVDFGWKDIAPASKWALPYATPEQQVFICVLKKDGLADVELPMSSMQLRRRDGNPTMISCVIPDALTYYDYADDRINGEIVVMAGSLTKDGTRHLSELDRVFLDSISYDTGVLSSSMVVSGYKTTENVNPRPITITNITYMGLHADGKYRIRAKVNIFLRPGDTAYFGINFIVVDQIYIWVSPQDSWMEVAGT